MMLWKILMSIVKQNVEMILPSADVDDDITEKFDAPLLLIPALPVVNSFQIAQHYLLHDDEDDDEGDEDDEDDDEDHEDHEDEEDEDVDDYAALGLMCDEPRSNSIAVCDM